MAAMLLSIDASVTWEDPSGAGSLVGGPGIQIAEADDFVIGLDGFLNAISSGPDAARDADAHVLLSAWRSVGRGVSRSSAATFPAFSLTVGTAGSSRFVTSWVLGHFSLLIGMGRS